MKDGENITYADRLGKVLVGTLGGGVPLGVDASSSDIENRGRLARLLAWIHIPTNFTHLDFCLPFSFLEGGEP